MQFNSFYMYNLNKVKGLFYIRPHGNQGFYLVKQKQVPETEFSTDSPGQK